jgi:cytoskeletal protein RodZ
MGRHSAPDEPDLETADTTEFAPIAVDLAIPRGRHSHPDADTDERTDDERTDDEDTGDDSGDDGGQDAFPTIALGAIELEAPAAEPEHLPEAPAGDDVRTPTKADKAEQKAADKAADKAAKQAAKSERKQARADSGTRADLRMLRQNGAVRAQALAAVIVSFLLYTVVMLVLGEAGVYLKWIWIPIVASGFLVGLVLDLGHRRANKS